MLTLAAPRGSMPDLRLQRLRSLGDTRPYLRQLWHAMCLSMCFSASEVGEKGGRGAALEWRESEATQTDSLTGKCMRSPDEAVEEDGPIFFGCCASIAWSSAEEEWVSCTWLLFRSWFGQRVNRGGCIGIFHTRGIPRCGNGEGPRGLKKVDGEGIIS